MIPTQPPLRNPPLLVAEGGASAREPAHGVAAAELARRLGATAISVRAWLTADDEVIVSRHGSVRRGLRKVELGSLPFSELPQLPRLSDIATSLGPGFLLVVDASNVPTGDAVAAWAAVTSATTNPAAPPNMWLRGHDVEALARWATVAGVAGTTHGVRVEDVSGSLERHLSRLRDLGVTALALPRPSWSGGLVAMTHRFRREAWATGAEHTRMAVELLTMGVDAVEGPHPDRLTDAVTEMRSDGR